MSYSGSSRIHIRYANVPCPYCGADVTKPCRSESGVSYNFRYTHSEREWLWWHHPRHGQESK